MGSRSKPRDLRHATSTGRTRPRGKKRPETITFTGAFWDAVSARAEAMSAEVSRQMRNRRRRGAPSPYRGKVAMAIAAAFAPFSVTS